MQKRMVIVERLFKTHYVREQECLDGLWEFQTTDTFELPECYTDNIVVPSCWEMSIKYCRYIGCAAYRKKIYVARNSNIRFVFKGVSHTCKVYIDSVELGGHYSAFSGFSVVAKNILKGNHILEVLVDNAYSEKSRLHIPNDYFTYGGITRPVFMEYVSDCYIERTEFEAYMDNGKWNAAIRVFINNIAENEILGEIKIICADKEITLKGSLKNQTMISGIMEFENIKPWNPENPSLYEIKHILSFDGEERDDLVDRIGFRVVNTEGKKLLINGKRVFIKGVNRHEDHGVTGCAIPLQIMYSDIELIKDLGANGVRTSHYQNDERFLDLCDENGIMVWEESHARGGMAEDIEHPLFVEQSMRSMHEMLEYHYNHPSIIIWACLNEAASDTEEGREIFKTHLDYLATDKSRLHTFASDKHIDDICLDMVDICSVNMYPKWYGDGTAEYVLGRIKKHIKDTGNSEKPMLISEYGAGGIYNFHDVMHVRWSEEYQAEVLERVTNDLISDEDITGIFIWQFCDIRIKWSVEKQLTRPKSRNNKGLVDEFRRPKMAYYTVKRIFESIK